MECQVCYNNLSLSKNKSNKNGIFTCNKCDFIVCRNCVQTYIISKLDFPKCMNCKTEFSYEYLNSNLQKIFIKNIYSKHLENILFIKEESPLFKNTYMNIYKNQKRKILKDHLKVCDILIKIFNSQSEAHFRGQSQMKIKKSIILKLNNLNTAISINNEFKTRCTINNCNGILDSDWKCILCNSKICILCYKKKEINHNCIKTDLETVNILKTNTHSCPGCNLLISKIDGCDQMYCTYCQTPFSWKSGNIITGQIHNPHYFAWIRNNGINIDNNQCDNMNFDLIPFKLKEPIFIKVSKYIKNNRQDLLLLYGSQGRGPVRRILKTLIRFITTLFETEVPHWNQNLRNKNEKIRIDFLNNNLSEIKFKRRLRLRYLTRLKSNKIYEILNTLSNTIHSYIYLLWSSSKRNSIKNTIKYIDYITNLRHYFNNEFKLLSIKEDITTPYISNTFHIYDQYDFEIKGTFRKNDLDPYSDLNIKSII